MNEDEFEILIAARDEFSQTFDAAQNDLREIATAMTELERAGTRQGRMLDVLRGQYAALRAEWANSNAELNRLNQTMGRPLSTPVQAPLPGMGGLTSAANMQPLIAQSNQLAAAMRAIPADQLKMDLAELDDFKIGDAGLNELNRAAVKTVDAVQDVEKEVKQSRSAWERFKGTLKSVGNELNRVTRSAAGARKETGLLGVRINFTFFQFLRFAAALAGVQLGISVLSGTVIGLRNAIIGFNKDVETAVAQFTTLTGSVQFAEEWVERLIHFAAETPFQLKGVVEASRTLENFGGPALNNIEMLTTLGNVAAANGIELQNLTFWVGRFYGALSDSRPLGEALSRFQELGVISPHVRSEIEDMAKSGAALQDIWEVLEKEFENFNGGMERQEDTWKGLVAEFQDGANRILGQAFLPLFNFLKEGFAEANDAIASPETAQKLAQWQAMLTNALVVVREWLSVHIPQAISFLRQAWDSLRGPLLGIWVILSLIVPVLANLVGLLFSNEHTVRLLIAAYGALKFYTIAAGIWALTAAWRAEAAATSLAAATLKTFRSVLITTGVGALLVALGVIILLVAEDWKRAVNFIIIAVNAYLSAVEGMVNFTLDGLNRLVNESAKIFQKFLNVLGTVSGFLPGFMNPFMGGLSNARGALNEFLEGGGLDLHVTLDRIPKIKDELDEGDHDVDVEDPFEGIGDDIDRMFEDLQGFFDPNGNGPGGVTAQTIDEFAQALESINQIIADRITEAYIEGGREQADVVAQQQAEYLEQALALAQEIHETYGLDLPRALLKAFNTISDEAEELKDKVTGFASPLLIALAAIRARTQLHSDLSAQRTLSPVGDMTNTQNIRFGNTYIDQMTIMQDKGSSTIEPEVVSRAVSEGVRRGRFAEVGM